MGSVKGSTDPFYVEDDLVETNLHEMLRSGKVPGGTVYPQFAPNHHTTRLFGTVHPNRFER